VNVTDYLRAGLDPVALAQLAGIEPDPWQAAVLRSTSRRLLLNCSRQAGKSTVSSVLAVHTAVYTAAALVLLLSPSMRQSQELFRKCLAVYRAMGKPVADTAQTTQALTLENGSRIVSLPGGEDTIRGYSGVALLLVDEASRVADETYLGARPMVAVSGGRIVLMSTPAGRRGFFFEAAEHERAWEKVRVRAADCPRLAPEFLGEERAVMGEWMYRQEYELAFVDDATQLFGEDVIAAMFTSQVRPLFEEAR
jgi:hypothetical protein